MMTNEAMSSTTLAASSEIDKIINNLEEEYEQEIDDYKTHTNDKFKQIGNTIKYFFKYKLKPYLIGFFFVFVITRILGNIFAYLRNVYYVDYAYFSYCYFNIFWMVAPFVVFIFSTAYKEWQYKIRKMTLLWIAIINLIIEITKLLYLLDYGIFVPLIIKMPIVKGITPVMLLRLAQLSILIPVIGIFIFFISLIHDILSDRYVKISIMAFLITAYFNFSFLNKYSYNISVIRRMSTGAPFTIYEKDRFLHTLLTGATGAGKTSSYLLPQIVSDLDTKVRSEDAQKKAAYKALKKGHIYMVNNFEDTTFNINYFAANKGYENVLNKIKTTYHSCGMTIVAPDDSLTDAVYKYCENRGIPCNRLDPTDNDDGTKKKGCRGFNPLYMSPNIPEHRIHKEIVKTATLFGDVMQSVAELGGKSEQYFASINRSILTAFIILLELTFPELNDGRCPTPADLQDLINDFSRVQPYFNQMVSNSDYVSRYQFVVDFIAYDILGGGAKNMIEQARGLRNIMNEFLVKPEIREIMCSQDSIDLDAILANGEVTVVNYELALGEKDATTFGLFFALSFNDAVLRRPGTEDTRLPHFYVIDELPVLLHKQHEKCFSLFRKYRVAMTVAIQTLDQMDRNETTKYLRGIIISCCAHSIMYGRAGITEMETFSKLAGKEYRATEENTVSQTSLTSTDPSFSYSIRETMEQENIVEETDIRNRGFQEVTVFSVQNGTLVKPFHGRLGFLTDKQKAKISRYTKNWTVFYNEDIISKTSVKELLEDKIFFTSSGAYKETLFEHQASTIIENKSKNVILEKVPSSSAVQTVPYNTNEDEDDSEDKNSDIMTLDI